MTRGGPEACGHNHKSPPPIASSHKNSIMEELSEWMSENDPLSRAAFDSINSDMLRSVGTPGPGAQIRECNATEVGVFAHEHDTALYQIGDGVDYAELIGVPVASGYVPLLTTVPGPVGNVNLFHGVFHFADSIKTPGPTAIPDGGQPHHECGDVDEGHSNPKCVCNTTDEERVEELKKVIAAAEERTGERPMLMPLDEEGKAPIIQGRARLDSDRGRGFLHTPEEAYEKLRDGYPGFVIYAGKPDHNTSDLAFGDHDDEDEYPAPTAEPTLEVMSGSGGTHEWWKNDGTVSNARVGDDYGEIRAENWYVVMPGSIHPTGGIYHIKEDRPIATISDDDLDDSMRPSTASGGDTDTSEWEPVEWPDGGAGDLRNYQGRTLDEIRRRSGDLDALLTDIEPSSPSYESASEADMATASRLWFWGFSKPQIVQIIKQYRAREKTITRDKYVRQTVAKAADGERIGGDDPDEHDHYGPKKCAPPPQNETTDRSLEERRDRMGNERLEAHLDRGGLAAWTDPFGVGKTTSSVRGVYKRDLPVTLYQGKHANCRQSQKDDAMPDGMHPKGAGQPRHDCCMDAVIAADDPADAECDEHGEFHAMPRMCPVYELPKDDETRRAFEALAGRIGVYEAHQILDLHEMDFHGEECMWDHQFSEADRHDVLYAPYEYQPLDAAQTKGSGDSEQERVQIVDESPRVLSDETRLSSEDLSAAVADIRSVTTGLLASNAAGLTLQNMAEFIERVRDSLHTDTEIRDIDTPDYLLGPDDPTAPETATEAAEAMAQAKHAYNSAIILRMERDEWDGEQLIMDDVLALIAEAAGNPRPAQRAMSVPKTPETCPLCGSSTGWQRGRHVCGCGWDEEYSPLVYDHTPQTRSVAYQDHAGEIVTRTLPDTSDLPDDILFTDATPAESALAALYGVDTDDIHIESDGGAYGNITVTQTVGAMRHPGTVENAIEEGYSSAEKIQKAINMLGEQCEKPLYFVGRKSLKEKLDFPDHGTVVVAGSQRGLNFIESDGKMLVGAPHPNVDDLFHEARLLAQGRDDIRVGGEEYGPRNGAGEPIYRKLNYEDENGDGLAIPTKGYSGLVGELFENARRHEIEQAVGRLRANIRDEAEDIPVFLLTNVPTDIPIDETCTLEELVHPELSATLDIRDGAVRTIEYLVRAFEGDVPGGFRVERLVEETDDGWEFYKSGVRDLLRVYGEDLSKKTVNTYVNEIEAAGLAVKDDWEQHEGEPFEVDIATLKEALQVFSHNASFKVAVQRRLRRIFESAGDDPGWIGRALDVIEGVGGGDGTDPPPDDPSDLAW